MEVKLGPYVGYFLWSLVLGAVLAVLYDLLRLSRRIVKTSDFAVNVQDIVFLILSGIGLSYISYEVNNGVMRVYAIFGMIIGFSIYRIILGTHIVDALEWWFNQIIKLVRGIIKLVTVPLLFIIKLIYKPFLIAVKSLNKLKLAMWKVRMHKKSINIEKSNEN